MKHAAIFAVLALMLPAGTALAQGSTLLGKLLLRLS